MNHKLNIVALLAVRNEELYIEKCIQHLLQQGIRIYLIDNESTDRTIEIANKYLNYGVIDIKQIPFNGIFDLTAQLKIKEELSTSLDADWFIHHDADEIRYAPGQFTTLLDGIAEADKLGFSAINFDEFVFIPTSKDQCFENVDYVKLMQHYYYFSPKPLRRVNAWKKTNYKVNLTNSGGHSAYFQNMKIFPINFILRHYIFLSYKHACSKYGNRIHATQELQKGWHIDRELFNANKIILPTPDQLKHINADGNLDASDPWKYHTFIGRRKFQYWMTKIGYRIQKYISFK